MDIPEETADLAAWLEKQLVGLDLAALMAELSAVSPVDVKSPLTLDDVLGDHLSSVLDAGMSDVPTNRLRALLGQPRLLLALQERIFVEGREYWQKLSSNRNDVQDLAEQGWHALSAALSPRASERSQRQQETLKLGWYRRPGIVSLVTAACIFVAMLMWDLFLPPQTASVASDWGWSRADAIPQDVSADVYFERLADAAQEWFKKRPDTAKDFAARIGQFRLGCSTLILADHRPLSAAERTWLIDKCRAWAVKLDQHLTAAEADDPDVFNIRDEADKTIHKLIDALRSRAEGLG